MSGREAIVPAQRTRGIRCRECNKELPSTGAWVLSNDAELLEAIGKSPVCLLGVIAGRTDQRARRSTCAAASALAGRLQVYVADPAACPSAIVHSGVSGYPTLSLLVGGKRLATLEGDAPFDDCWRWILDALLRFNLRASKRPLEPCLRCGGRQLLRCLPVEQGLDAPPGRDPQLRLRRLAVAHIAEPQRFDVVYYGDYRAQLVALDPNRVAGELEAYVCRACGHVEWFAFNPELIPIGPEHPTELIEVPERSPYR